MGHESLASVGSEPRLVFDDTYEEVELSDGEEYYIEEEIVEEEVVEEEFVEEFVESDEDHHGGSDDEDDDDESGDYMDDDSSAPPPSLDSDLQMYDDNESGRNFQDDLSAPVEVLQRRKKEKQLELQNIAVNEGARKAMEEALARERSLQRQAAREALQRKRMEQEALKQLAEDAKDYVESHEPSPILQNQIYLSQKQGNEARMRLIEELRRIDEALARKQVEAPPPRVYGAAEIETRKRALAELRRQAARGQLQHSNSQLKAAKASKFDTSFSSLQWDQALPHTSGHFPHAPASGQIDMDGDEDDDADSGSFPSINISGEAEPVSPLHTSVSVFDRLGSDLELPGSFGEFENSMNFSENPIMVSFLPEQSAPPSDPCAVQSSYGKDDSHVANLLVPATETAGDGGETYGHDAEKETAHPVSPSATKPDQIQSPKSYKPKQPAFLKQSQKDHLLPTPDENDEADPTRQSQSAAISGEINNHNVEKEKSHPAVSSSIKPDQIQSPRSYQPRPSSFLKQSRKDHFLPSPDENDETDPTRESQSAAIFAQALLRPSLVRNTGKWGDKASGQNDELAGEQEGPLAGSVSQKRNSNRGKPVRVPSIFKNNDDANQVARSVVKPSDVRAFVASRAGKGAAVEAESSNIAKNTIVRKSSFQKSGALKVPPIFKTSKATQQVAAEGPEPTRRPTTVIRRTVVVRRVSKSPGPHNDIGGSPAQESNSFKPVSTQGDSAPKTTIRRTVFVRRISKSPVPQNDTDGSSQKQPQESTKPASAPVESAPPPSTKVGVTSDASNPVTRRPSAVRVPSIFKEKSAVPDIGVAPVSPGGTRAKVTTKVIRKIPSIAKQTEDNPLVSPGPSTRLARSTPGLAKGAEGDTTDPPSDTKPQGAAPAIRKIPSIFYNKKDDDAPPSPGTSTRSTRSTPGLRKSDAKETKEAGADDPVAMKRIPSIFYKKKEDDAPPSPGTSTRSMRSTPGLRKLGAKEDGVADDPVAIKKIPSIFYKKKEDDAPPSPGTSTRSTRSTPGLRKIDTKETKDGGGDDPLGAKKGHVPGAGKIPSIFYKKTEDDAPASPVTSRPSIKGTMGLRKVLGKRAEDDCETIPNDTKAQVPVPVIRKIPAIGKRAEDDAPASPGTSRSTPVLRKIQSTVVKKNDAPASPGASRPVLGLRKIQSVVDKKTVANESTEDPASATTMPEHAVRKIPSIFYKKSEDDAPASPGTSTPSIRSNPALKRLALAKKSDIITKVQPPEAALAATSAKEPTHSHVHADAEKPASPGAITPSIRSNPGLKRLSAAKKTDIIAKVQPPEAAMTATSAEEPTHAHHPADAEKEVVTVPGGIEVTKFVSPRTPPAIFQKKKVAGFVDGTLSPDVTNPRPKAKSMGLLNVPSHLKRTDIPTTPKSQPKYYTFEDLKEKRIEDIDYSHREQYLSPDEFERIFHISKANFEQLPKWKQDLKKKQSGLF